MDALYALFGQYYGLDWATLAFGLGGSYLVTGGHLRRGFTLGILACSCGFGAAMLSGQNGFIVYNVMLAALNMRGILRQTRLATARTRAGISADAPAPVPAR